MRLASKLRVNAALGEKERREKQKHKHLLLYCVSVNPKVHIDRGETESMGVKLAKKVLSENSKVLYGIIGVVESSNYFPPQEFLNQFFEGGSDPCDQDGRMDKWKPFNLNHSEYQEVLSWWQSTHQNVVQDDLGAGSWNDWVQELLER